MTGILKNIFIIYFTVLAFLLIFSLICAIKGPRFTDRIIAVNVIGTISTAVICAASVYIKEPYLTDIALVYALLNFLSVVILSRIVTLEKNRHKIDEKREEKSSV